MENPNTSKQLLVPSTIGQRNSFRKRPGNSFISRLALTITVLAVGIASTVSYELVRRIILTTLKENALKEVQRASSDIDEWLAAMRAQVESMANNSAVRSMNWSVAAPFLQLEVERLPDYYQIGLINPDGSFYTTKAGFVKGENLSDIPFFQEVLKGKTVVSDLLISRTTGIRQVTVIAPIWSVPPLNRSLVGAKSLSIRAKNLKSFNLLSEPTKKPKIIGLLSAPISVDHVTQVVKKLSRADRGSYAFALDSQGVLLAHPDQQLLQSGKSFLQHPEAPLLAISRNMVHRREGVELVQLNSLWVYIAYTPLDNANWSLALVIPKESLEEGLRPLNLLAFVVGTLLATATVIGVWQLKLFESTRESAAREALLNRLIERIRASLDLGTILQTTVDEVAVLMGLNLVAFGWYRADKGKLEILCASQRENLPESLREINNFCRGDLGESLGRGEEVRFNNIAKSSQLNKEVKTAFLEVGVNSYLALPVLTENRSTGYLICMNRSTWHKKEKGIEMLTAVRDQLAIAITQANLYSQVQAQVKLLNQTLHDRDEAEAQLKQKMEMLDRSSDGIIIRDMNDEIIYWNQGAENLYGWTKTEVLGQYIHTFLKTTFPTSQTEVLEKFRREGTWEGELIHITKDGRTIIVASRWTLQRDELDRPGAQLEINNDITERKAAEIALGKSESELRQKAAQLEEALREIQQTQSQVIQSEKMSSLGQLVAGIAHEINNPVNFIYGNLVHAEDYTHNLINLLKLYQKYYPNSTPEIVEESVANDIEFILEDVPKLLGSMKVGAKRIQEIVASLRNFSRMDEAEMKEVDIHEGIDSTLMILQNRLKPKSDRPGIEVIKNYGKLPLIECYAGQLNQVFMNIFTNALDALEEQPVQQLDQKLELTPPTIKISTEMLTKERLSIRIQDNGPGIPEAIQTRLFDPFFTTKPIGKGTGLGLSISYQIVTKKHGGSLQCFSRPGEGTEFAIEIPVRQG